MGRCMYKVGTNTNVEPCITGPKVDGGNGHNAAAKFSCSSSTAAWH